MNVPSLLENRDSVYGALAIWIILFHTFRKISMPFIPGVTNIIGIGNMAVDVFMLYSGICLTLSAIRHNCEQTGWKDFYKRRMARVLLPYLVICVPFYLWSAFCEHSGTLASSIGAFFANILSVNFWLKGRTTTWFVYGIILCYALFPFLYNYARRKTSREKIFLLAGLVIFALIASCAPILKNSRIAWLRLPIFAIGVMIGVQGNKMLIPWLRISKKAKLALSAAIFIILGCVTSADEVSRQINIHYPVRVLLYLPMTLALAYMIAELKVLRKLLNNRFFAMLGLISLELYLIHVPLLHPFKQYGVINAVGYWLYLVLPVSSIALSAGAYAVEQNILKKGLLK